MLLSGVGLRRNIREYGFSECSKEWHDTAPESNEQEDHDGGAVSAGEIIGPDVAGCTGKKQVGGKTDQGKVCSRAEDDGSVRARLRNDCSMVPESLRI